MSRCQNDGIGVMIWGLFFHYGGFCAVEVHECINAQKYIETLKHLVPFMEEFHTENAMCQHDNASLNAVIATEKYLADRDIDVMNWPARSPALNTDRKV